MIPIPSITQEDYLRWERNGFLKEIPEEYKMRLAEYLNATASVILDNIRYKDKNILYLVFVIRLFREFKKELNLTHCLEFFRKMIKKTYPTEKEFKKYPEIDLEAQWFYDLVKLYNTIILE